MPFKLSPRQVADNCRLPVHAIVSKGCHGRTDADSLSEGARHMLLYSKKGEKGDGRQKKPRSGRTERARNCTSTPTPLRPPLRDGLSDRENEKI
jgi:hypothetical protein